MSARTRSVILCVAAAIALLCFIAVYTMFDPSTSHLFPRCIFYQLTGLKCPGCGSQRAIHALLCGNIIEALRFNAMLVASLPLLALYAYCEVCRLRHRTTTLCRRLNSPTMAWSIFIIILAWWALRNLLNL